MDGGKELASEERGSEGARAKERRERTRLRVPASHETKGGPLKKESLSLLFEIVSLCPAPRKRSRYKLVDISQQSAGSEKGMRQRGLGRECRQSVGVNALFFSSTNQNQSPKSPHINSPLFLTFPKNLKQAFPPFFSSSRQRQEKTQNDQARDRFDPAGRLRGSR